MKKIDIIKGISALSSAKYEFLGYVTMRNKLKAKSIVEEYQEIQQHIASMAKTETEKAELFKERILEWGEETVENFNWYTFPFSKLENEKFTSSDLEPLFLYNIIINDIDS